MKDTRTEKQIQNSIIYLLKVRRIPHSITDVGLMRDKTGAFKFKRGTLGWPDLSCVLPGGRFLGIEVKREKGKVSELQSEMHKIIQSQGGLILIARSADDVDTFLQEYL